MFGLQKALKTLLPYLLLSISFQPTHVKARLLGSNLTVPVSYGKLNLGTWQGVWLCEHREQAGSRKVLVTVNGAIEDPEGTPLELFLRSSSVQLFFGGREKITAKGGCNCYFLLVVLSYAIKVLRWVLDLLPCWRDCGHQMTKPTSPPPSDCFSLHSCFVACYFAWPGNWLTRRNRKRRDYINANIVSILEWKGMSKGILL